MAIRDIIFRGKRIDNGEWVEGGIAFEDYTDKVYIVRWNTFGLGFFEYIEVIPETVGQYTGLYDKNGKKIFEGDIVNIRGDQTSEDWKHVNYNALIAFIDGGFCALDGTIEDHGFRRYALARMDFDLEVIGNIHDNRELLEADNGT